MDTHVQCTSQNVSTFTCKPTNQTLHLLWNPTNFTTRTHTHVHYMPPKNKGINESLPSLSSNLSHACQLLPYFVVG